MSDRTCPSDLIPESRHQSKRLSISISPKDLSFQIHRDFYATTPLDSSNQGVDRLQYQNLDSGS